MWRLWNLIFRREYVLLKGKYVVAVGIDSKDELTFLDMPYFQYNPSHSDGAAKKTVPLTPKLKKWWAENVK